MSDGAGQERGAAAAEERWQLTPVFVAAARHLSFSRAARALGVAPSSVSRSVGRLEALLGTTLFVRNPRSVALTEAGRLYLQHASSAIDAVADGEAALARHRGSPRGLVRLHAPSAFGRRCIAPLLPEFLAGHPEVDLELVLGDGFADLAAVGADLAIRVGNLDDTRMMARRLADNRRGIYASPDYVRRHPAPTAPEDLRQHQALGFSLSRRGAGVTWHLQRSSDAEVLAVRVPCRVRADDAELLCALAVAGSGVAKLARFLAEPEVRAGRLVRLLPDWEAPVMPVSAVWVGSSTLPPKTRALLEHLAGRLPSQLV